MSVLYTIGHGTRSFDEFCALLQGAGIQAVVDVRSAPGSRKYPHFGKAYLQEHLPERGIEYVHFPDLGGFRKALPDSVNAAWTHPAFRGYADYMMSGEFWAALDEMLTLARRKPTAIMCSETVWWRCHRRMVADAATARGFTVLHVISAAPPRPHELSPHGRLDGDRVTYQGQGA